MTNPETVKLVLAAVMALTLIAFVAYAMIIDAKPSKKPVSVPLPTVPRDCIDALRTRAERPAENATAPAKAEERRETKMPEKKFMLIEVVERKISEPEFFPDAESAKTAMLDKFKAVTGLTDEDLAAAEPETVVGGESAIMCVDQDTYFTDRAAMCEVHGENYDWKIFEI